jgi:hypothetical protein
MAEGETRDDSVKAIDQTHLELGAHDLAQVA